MGKLFKFLESCRECRDPVLLTETLGGERNCIDFELRILGLDDIGDLVWSSIFIGSLSMDSSTTTIGLSSVV